MTPSPWEFLLLALAAYRLTRLAAWDTFPLARRVRAWAIGERIRDGGLVHDRPVIAELLGCAFCAGFWISLAVYLVWVVAPAAALAVSSVLAVSAVVGLVAKNLDP